MAFCSASWLGEIPLRFWEEKETNDKVVGPQRGQ